MTHDDKDWATPGIKEFIFWRDGMTPEEFEEERAYYYASDEALMNCTYSPLWAQREKIKEWIKVITIP